MTKRLNYAQASPGLMQAMRGMQEYADSTDLEPLLIELVKIRASQINGCAYCLDMHTKDARALGETEQRIYTLSAWRETPFFSERERAALAWTEAVTLLSENDIPDELYADTLKHFSEKDLADLTLVIIVINGWNRLAVPFRSEPGHYQPKRQVAQAGR